MAIAFDASSQSSGYSQSSGFTLSHTTSGSDRCLVLVVCMGGASPDSDFTSLAATYNGSSMTSIAGSNATNSQRRIATFYLVAPSTGANNIAVSWSGGGSEIRIFGISFTGVAQTSTINTSATTSPGAGTSSTVSLTTTVDNVMMVCGIFVREGGGGAITLSSGTITNQDQTTGAGYLAGGAAGSNSITWNVPSGAFAGGSVCNNIALAPATAAGPANMKTWDGLATASIKTMDGLAIASVKTWNGLN